ncbi:MAG: NUDIX domain-containing protein [Reyranella sp.]|uniref:NUDIX domain-containing protein n=1 Tax=Reyranella sp. TaxID=1929291 RepID=UPI002731FC5B|nr:NUDIX domain-containing protein [Reyranella sp.]MDP1966134.1 NUDIX domain-containing protein [Reyranella sp.]MDP2374128.1 NUDIX domain-containing protein [Reyranella sp.]
MATPPPPDEKAELVEHVAAFQGYFKVGRYFFRHSLHQGGQSPVISREVFERGHAAGVLPYDPIRDEVVLIRQFRAGLYVAGRHPWGWETVAGIIEDGETPEQVVHREAIEEAGLKIGDLIPIHNLMLSPGAMSESCALFLGRVDSTTAGGVFGLESEGEDILVKVVPFAEARAMLDRGEIDNAAAVVALQWLALHSDEVRNRWR